MTEVSTPSEEVLILSSHEIEELVVNSGSFEFDKKTSFFKEILLYYLYLYLLNRGVDLKEMNFSKFVYGNPSKTDLKDNCFMILYHWFTSNFSKKNEDARHAIGNYTDLLNAIKRSISIELTPNSAPQPTPETILILLFIIRYSFPGTSTSGDVKTLTNASGLPNIFKLRYLDSFQALITNAMLIIKKLAEDLVACLVNIRRRIMIQERGEYESYLQTETRKKIIKALKKSIGELSDQNIEEECKKLRDDLAENLKSLIEQFIKLFKLDEFMIPNPEG